MNVLWICNNSILANIDGRKVNSVFTGGWVQANAKEVLEHGDINLSYCFPLDEMIEGEAEGLIYYSMPYFAGLKMRISNRKYAKESLKRFRYVLGRTDPDVIHIYGTETAFQRGFIYLCKDMGLLSKCVVWIQGLKFFWGPHFYDGLDRKVVAHRTWKEFVSRTSIKDDRARFAWNGKEEVECIGQLRYVFTRTDWDKASCRFINPKVGIIECNETLRPEFYQDRIWDIAAVKRHSIFVSQCSYSIKGFHQLIKAVATIAKAYPDVRVRTTGPDIVRIVRGTKEYRGLSSYQLYLRELIVENHLEEHFTFLGSLAPARMRGEYLSCNVYVQPSSMENSPNSLGEAMILGVPCIASDVGGVSSLLNHRKEGLLYPFSEVQMLSYYIEKIFADDGLACRFSVNARKRALATHDRETNYKALVEGYKLIMEGSGSQEGDHGLKGGSLLRG